jgi:3-deoxy-7-phosphoheptulonate synthase
MSILTDDLRIANMAQLIAPAILCEEFCLNDADAQFIVESRRTVERILKGEDDRLLVVAGPCSIHDTQAAEEYAKLLREFANEASNELFLVMRVYFEKPRTTVGWKGLINDPGMDNTFDINRGLRLARSLLLDLAKMRVPAGTEFLDTISPQFVADLVTWGAIGARTTESQVHRELASGLSMAVGFKNGTEGSIQIALDAIKAAQCRHHFLSVKKSGITAIVTTKGNDSCHLILRGSAQGPNYDRGSVAGAANLLSDAGLLPHLMVDCSHGNSQKDHRKQPVVAADVAAQLRSGSREIVAVMIESHLKEGSQPLTDPKNLEYGVSVTDGCVDWSTTVWMLNGLRDAVIARRKLGK